MITIIFYAVIAAGVAFGGYEAWSGFKSKIAAPYVQAQIASDQKAVDKANAAQKDAENRAQNAQTDTAACTVSLTKQTGAVAAWQAAAAKNQADAQKAKAQALIATAAEATTKASYLAILRAPPKKDETCQQKLDSVDKLLRDAARARQAVPK